MENKHIPFYWHVEDLTLVNYHRYTSFVVDSFMSIKTDEKETYPNEYKWFMDLKQRVINSIIIDDDGKEIARQWDNKIVIECLTSNGNRIFVGYCDWTMCIGLGVRSDDWIKPRSFK